jgi:hypothetical protein
LFLAGIHLLIDLKAQARFLAEKRRPTRDSIT